MDLTPTIESSSEQIDANDLIGSPRTVTVTGVSKGSADQPINIQLAEIPGKAFRPCKSMRRVIVAAWGKDSAAYIGRRMTLYCDPTVKWGGQAVGGVRISHMSYLDKPLTVSLTVTRGKRAPYKVAPLPDAPQPRSDGLADERIAECVDTELLRDWWRLYPGKRDAINARVAELQAAEQVDIETGEIPMDDDGPMFPEAS